MSKKEKISYKQQKGINGDMRSLRYGSDGTGY